MVMNQIMNHQILEYKKLVQITIVQMIRSMSKDEYTFITLSSWQQN
jgi:hypothetical protein